MMSERDKWPKRPEGEVFPEVLTTIEVAQLLRFDATAARTPEQAARSVRSLVKGKGLPACGKVGRGYLFRKSVVLAWLSGHVGRVGDTSGLQ